MNLVLPEVSVPGGSYSSVNIRGKIAYIAIQFPILNGDFKFQGKLGKDLTTKQGYEAMKLCALNVLSQIEDKIGIDNINGLNHIEAYYVATDDWDDAPIVVNGASDLFSTVLGEKGKHSRTILGVHNLPRNFSVGLTTSFTLD
ncbi:RidA family protein [Fulvivirga lutea]|uniref:RidA family protein n=2 Tax=Fulvivirga lutea TaxID=2810512 RepID=A0A974WIQ3_9BACT|nr:RidA family protein [Fulvivirga lutea]